MHRMIEWTGVLLAVTAPHGDRPAVPLQETWHVVEELRIGSVDGEGAATFGRIAALEVSSDGRLFVLEDQANELRSTPHPYLPPGAQSRSRGNGRRARTGIDKRYVAHTVPPELPVRGRDPGPH